MPHHSNSKSSDDTQAYTWLKPDHDMLAMDSSTHLALDSNNDQIAGDLALFTTVRTYFR